MTKFKTLMQAVKAREEDEKGFTLIELIIVIAIIGILVAIAIPVYGSIQQNARNKAAQSAASNGLTMAVAAAVGDPAANEAGIKAAADKADTDKIEVTAVVTSSPAHIKVTATGKTDFTVTDTVVKESDY